MRRFTLWALALVLTVSSVATGQNLTTSRERVTSTTSRSRGGNAIALSTEIAVSETDLRTLKAYIDAQAGSGGGVASGATLPASPAQGAVFVRTGATNPGIYVALLAGSWTGPVGVLADGSVTTAKLADDAVIGRKIAGLSVASGHIVDNAIISRTIPSNAIITRHVASDTITQGEMAANSVNTSELVNGGVTAAKLAVPQRLPTCTDGQIVEWDTTPNPDAWICVAKPSGGGGGGTDQTARDAAAAARAVADANRVVINRFSVFEHYELDPGGISGTEFPEFMALKASRKIVNKTISQIAVNLGGQNVGNIVRNTSPTPPATDPAAPFNNGVPELSGGIVNLVLTSQARSNLRDSVSVANGSPQFIGVEVTVTFTDGTSATDLMHFGTNNNAFRSTGLNQSQVDARVLAMRSLVTTAATPVGTDRVFFTDENQSGDPLRYSQISSLVRAGVNDDLILDQAQTSRGTADRGKALVVSADNENELSLVNLTAGGATDSVARAATTTNRGLIDNIRQLPTFPAAGSRDNMIPKFDGNTLGWEADATGTGGLNQNQVDARIAPYARATPSGTIADAQIPAAITRDTELNARIPAAAAGRIPAATSAANQVWKTNASGVAGWRADATGGGTPAANSITAAQARANTAAFAREWRNRLGISDDWSEIANGTAIGLGKVVEHGGAYFGAITAHSKSSTGPDGDAANWSLLTTFYGTWSNVWFPAGAVVIRNGSPYMAGQAVVRNDPAPDAGNNVKWISLGGGGAPDLRGSFSTAAVPTAQDRFFFTDENQSGDPVRYVTFTNLQNALSGRTLTLAQQIGLTHANTNPATIQYSSASDLAAKLATTINVVINDRAEITSNVWVLARFATPSRTIAQTARTALGTSTNDITIDASAVAANIRNAAANDLVVDGELLRVDLAWYSAASGGAAVSTQRYTIPVISTAGGPTRVHSANYTISPANAYTATSYTMSNDNRLYTFVAAHGSGISSGVVSSNVLLSLPSTTAGSAATVTNNRLTLGNGVYIARTAAGVILVAATTTSTRNPMPLEIWRH